MKLVYEAANSLEAHMIVNLLEQQGVRAEINGAFLQGAMGELPAAGMIRVMVEDEDVARAKEIVQAWDTAQPAAAPAGAGRAPESVRGGRAFPAFIGGVVGLIIGIVIMSAHYKLPAQTEGIDYNNDGVLDEKWVYSTQGRLVSTQSDRNFDGKVDDTASFEYGQIDTVEADLDFDGVIDTVTTYRMGNQHVMESDTDNDGYRDTRTHFTSNNISSVEFIYPETGKPQKVDYFNDFVKTHSEVDTDIDGKMDQRINYDKIGMVKSAESLR